jgi:hypothetical protein
MVNYPEQIITTDGHTLRTRTAGDPAPGDFLIEN